MESATQRATKGPPKGHQRATKAASFVQDTKEKWGMGKKFE